MFGLRFSTQEDGAVQIERSSNMHNSCRDLSLSKTNYRKHERLNTDLYSLKTDQS